MTVVWKPRACGRTESFPEMLDTAAFFPGYTWADVHRAERIVMKLDILGPRKAWAREIPKQAAALKELFASRGYAVAGVARVDVTDQAAPVWAALLMEIPKP